MRSMVEGAATNTGSGFAPTTAFGSPPPPYAGEDVACTSSGNKTGEASRPRPSTKSSL